MSKRELDISNELKQLIEGDEVLKYYVTKNGIPKFKLESDPFISLFEMIIGQQLSVKAADAILNRATALLKEDIQPENVASHTQEDFRACGVSKQKYSYIMSLSVYFLDKGKHLDFAKMSNEEIRAELIQIKGIGPWSIDMFLMFSLGRMDIFSVGDLGLRNALKQLYAVDESSSHKEMEEFAEKWIPYRSVASLVLWEALGI